MPTLHLYDTLSRSVRALEPANGKLFRFYCCGPTVYGPAHIGNFRTFLMQDVFRRVIEACGVASRHVRNITDVDDKTIRASSAQGMKLADFTRQWTERFHADCAALNLLPPHVEQSAVEAIPRQVALIGQLLAGGHAYRADDGSVYFDVSSFPGYGALSRLHEREITTGSAARPGVQVADEYDRDSAADFALWKARRPDDGGNFWDSPWGPGRPGWHIECSAMSLHHLGEDFDLHGGGIDLVFPHHENEIAQSEAATGRRFCRHWFHVAHLTVGGAKMSKSLGNLFTLDDIRDRGFTPAELRYLLVSGTYRQPLNFTWESLGAARQALRKLARLRTRLTEAAGRARPGIEPGAGRFRPAWDALLDDLNTPEALGRTFSAAKELDRLLAAGEIDGLAAAHELRGLAGILSVLGLELEPASAPAAAADVPAPVRELGERRWKAKQARDFAAADAIRQQLLEEGWTVKDTKSGYELSPAEPRPHA